MLDDFIWLKAAASHGALDLLRRETSFSTPLDPFDYPTPYIRPLVDAYFFVTWRIFGLDPRAYHALNLALHACVGLAVALLGWQLLRSKLAGLLGAALFLALPTYDFAVTWVSEATDLIFTLFYVLSLSLFLAHLRRAPDSARPELVLSRVEGPVLSRVEGAGEGRPGGGRGAAYFASLAAFTLALLSKEPAITLAGVAALAVLAQPSGLSRDDLKRRAIDLAPFALLALAFYFGIYGREYDTISGSGVYRLDSRLLGNYWDYLKWVAFPFDPDSRHEVARTAAALGFLGLGVFVVATRQRTLAFLFLWTLVCLVPLSLFAHGIDHRYAYLVSVPFALFLVGLLQQAFGGLTHEPVRRNVALAALVLVALPFLASEVRSRQAWAHGQARAYDAIFKQVPQVCGALPPGSRIAIVDSPAFDLAGIDTQVALNFAYDHVLVELYAGGQPLKPVAPGAQTCVARWDGSGFVKGS